MSLPDIKNVIRRYFHHDHPAGVRNAFEWLMLHGDRQREAREAMEELWQETPSVMTTQTVEDLQRLHKAMGLGGEPQPKVIHAPLRYKVLLAACVALLLVCTAVATFYGTRDYLFTHRTGEEFAQYTVAEGMTRELTLPDSTHVTLRGGTTLVCPAAFSSDTRSVFLVGEAQFDVAKDPRRPFIVKTEQMAVTALGTRFNVSAYPADDIVRTVLMEGVTQVAVQAGHQDNKSPQTYRMHPNQQLTYDKQTGHVALSDLENTESKAMEDGCLVFNGEDLHAIAVMLRHRYGVRLVCDQPQRLKGSFYGKFAPNETVDDVLRVLSHIGTPFTWEHRGSTIVIHPK